MTPSILDDIKRIQAIESVPHILKMLSEATGLRFICIARVTENKWTMCAVLDLVNFDLTPGDELAIHTTFCSQVRSTSKPVIINSVHNDQTYHDSPIPKMYNFESYFSYPIYDQDGSFFGTLCGLDPKAADLKNERIESQIQAFSNLLSRQLMAQERIDKLQTALSDEKEIARLREQYIAILGHDIRTPLSSLSLCVDLLKDHTNDTFINKILGKMTNSVARMNGLINDVMDFTYGRVGDGLKLNLRPIEDLSPGLEHTISELAGLHSTCEIIADIQLKRALVCDSDRICQLLSNLLVNAITHGDNTQPIYVTAYIQNGQFTLEVKNQGKTIPTTTLESLFQPFWRSLQDKNSKGLGLGLFIASEIAKAHEGKLTVASHNQETLFTFTMSI
ncbi:HAMP domain-containing histidine kinase [Alteromonas ponticola]|uniref:histidine kinase n=1 Tax=Alteromonas aquimaris TaxID=2998417 RepID=A0ABT3P7W1_9ALTE|nr:HAMP domain-containing sensor histidine kinase [Alteromonas aquimaris]MCW8108864.1 HAMP domain-containing histidine kinase [Alteromonas aquimaris]